jgi:hypothetical protein
MRGGSRRSAENAFLQGLWRASREDRRMKEGGIPQAIVMMFITARV